MESASEKDTQVLNNDTEVKKNENAEEDVGEKVAPTESVAKPAEGPTKLESQIIRQIEYYFSDVNMLRDKFLIEQVKKDEEGWVPISVLLTFKRLAAMTNDAKVVADAMFKSDENLVEVSEDHLKLRRDPERTLPVKNDDHIKGLRLRTIYVKGFPLTTTISEVIDFLQPFNKVMNVNMRKYLDKPAKMRKFKGSIFVTFDTVENAKAFLENDTWDYKGNNLIKKFQNDYIKEKEAEYEEKKKKKEEKEKEKAEEESKIDLPKGAVIKFNDAPEDVTRELIREAIEKIESENDAFEIAFIEFSKGQSSGHVRFRKENAAAEFVGKLEENKLKLKDDIVLTFSTLTEEEDNQYLRETAKYMKNKRKQSYNKKRHGNRKRQGINDDEKAGNKEKKFKSDNIEKQVEEKTQ